MSKIQQNKHVKDDDDDEANVDLDRLGYDIAVMSQELTLPVSPNLQMPREDRKPFRTRRVIPRLVGVKLPSAGLKKFHPTQTVLRLQERVTPRILVVDDNSVATLTLHRSLMKKGWESHVAFNGKQALEVLTQYVFDVVLVDLRMPVMDGMALTRRIRAAQSADRSRVCVTVIGMVSPYEFTEMTLKEAYNSGMDRYVLKPAHMSLPSLTLIFSVRPRKDPYTVFRRKCIEGGVYSHYEEIKTIIGDIRMSCQHDDDVFDIEPDTDTTTLLTAYDDHKDAQVRLSSLFQRQKKEHKNDAYEQVNVLRDVVKSLEKDIAAAKVAEPQVDEAVLAARIVDKWRMDTQTEANKIHATMQKLQKKVRTLEKSNKQLKLDLSDVLMRRTDARAKKRFFSYAEISRTLLERRECHGMALEDDLAHRSFHNYVPKADSCQEDYIASWLSGPLKRIRRFVTRYDLASAPELQEAMEDVYERERQWWRKVREDNLQVKEFLYKLQRSPSEAFPEHFADGEAQTDPVLLDPTSLARPGGAFRWFGAIPRSNTGDSNNTDSFGRREASSVVEEESRQASERPSTPMSMCPPPPATDYLPVDLLEADVKARPDPIASELLRQIRHREGVIDRMRESECYLRDTVERNVQRLYNEVKRIVARTSLQGEVRLVPPPPVHGDRPRVFDPKDYSDGDVRGSDTTDMFASLSNASDVLRDVFMHLGSRPSLARRQSSKSHSSDDTEGALSGTVRSRARKTVGSRETQMETHHKLVSIVNDVENMARVTNKLKAAVSKKGNVGDKRDTSPPSSSSKGKKPATAPPSGARTSSTLTSKHTAALKACSQLVFKRQERLLASNVGETSPLIRAPDDDLLSHPVGDDDTIETVSSLYGVPPHTLKDRNPSLSTLGPHDIIRDCVPGLTDMSVPVTDDILCEVIKRVHTATVNNAASLAQQVALGGKKSAGDLELAIRQAENVEKMKELVESQATARLHTNTLEMPYLRVEASSADVESVADRFGVDSNLVRVCPDDSGALEVPLTESMLRRMSRACVELSVSHPEMFVCIGVIEYLLMQCLGEDAAQPHFLLPLGFADTVRDVSLRYSIGVDWIRSLNPFMCHDAEGTLIDTNFLITYVTNAALKHARELVAQQQQDKDNGGYITAALGPELTSMLGVALRTTSASDRLQTPPQTFVTIITHLVELGESLEGISASYRVPIREILLVNPTLHTLASFDEDLSDVSVQLHIPVFLSTLHALIMREIHEYIIARINQPAATAVERAWYAQLAIGARCLSLLENNLQLPTTEVFEHATFQGESTAHVADAYEVLPGVCRNIMVGGKNPGLSFSVDLRLYLARLHRSCEESGLRRVIVAGLVQVLSSRLPPEAALVSIVKSQGNNVNAVKTEDSMNMTGFVSVDGGATTSSEHHQSILRTGGGSSREFNNAVIVDGDSSNKTNNSSSIMRINRKETVHFSPTVLNKAGTFGFAKMGSFGSIIPTTPEKGGGVSEAILEEYRATVAQYQRLLALILMGLPPHEIHNHVRRLKKYAMIDELNLLRRQIGKLQKGFQPGVKSAITDPFASRFGEDSEQQLRASRMSIVNLDLRVLPSGGGRSRGGLMSEYSNPFNVSETSPSSTLMNRPRQSRPSVISLELSGVSATQVPSPSPVKTPRGGGAPPIFMRRPKPQLDHDLAILPTVAYRGKQLGSAATVFRSAYETIDGDSGNAKNVNAPFLPSPPATSRPNTVAHGQTRFGDASSSSQVVSLPLPQACPPSRGAVTTRGSSRGGGKPTKPIAAPSGSSLAETIARTSMLQSVAGALADTSRRHHMKSLMNIN